jgi:hypothetical protein
MSKADFVHGTVRGNGFVYIPHGFLSKNGFPHTSLVSFKGADDGLSFQMGIGEGPYRMGKGNFRIGPKVGGDFIRAMMKNKPEGYPYEYKGVYILEVIGPNLVQGKIVTNKVSSISDKS